MTDRDEMADVIHDVLRDVCTGADEADPGRVLCFEIATALVARGYGRVPWPTRPTY